MEMDAGKFHKLASTVFAPVYPVIADQILARTGVARGICLDIGCGGGYLGTAVARASELFVHFFDESPEMLEIVRRNMVENDLSDRAGTLQGDVAAIPLPDAAVDLAVSRGSIFFWEDLPRALSEIYRVLSPGGWAYVGGGFGSRELRETIERQMADRNDGARHFSDKVRRNLGAESRARFEAALEAAAIAHYSILHDEEIGLWITFQK